MQKKKFAVFKFGVYIVGNHPTYCVDFGEFRFYNFFFYRSSKNSSYALQPMESNYKKYASAKKCFRLSSNFICALSIADPRTILICV